GTVRHELAPADPRGPNYARVIALAHARPRPPVGRGAVPVPRRAGRANPDPARYHRPAYIDIDSLLRPVYGRPSRARRSATRRSTASPSCGEGSRRWRWPSAPIRRHRCWPCRVHYLGAVTDPDTGELISDAHGSEVEYTAFTETRYKITGLLIVRRVLHAGTQLGCRIGDIERAALVA